jgi:hypothetical protein
MRATRKQAIEAVERWYWTGKPCKYGHIAKRYTITGSCSQCLNESSRATQQLIRSRFAEKLNEK